MFQCKIRVAAPPAGLEDERVYLGMGAVDVAGARAYVPQLVAHAAEWTAVPIHVVFPNRGGLVRVIGHPRARSVALITTVGATEFWLKAVEGGDPVLTTRKGAREDPDAVSWFIQDSPLGGVVVRSVPSIRTLLIWVAPPHGVKGEARAPKVVGEADLRRDGYRYVWEIEITGSPAACPAEWVDRSLRVRAMASPPTAGAVPALPTAGAGTAPPTAGVRPLAGRPGASQPGGAPGPSDALPGERWYPYIAPGAAEGSLRPHPREAARAAILLGQRRRLEAERTSPAPGGTIGGPSGVPPTTAPAPPGPEPREPPVSHSRFGRSPTATSAAPPPLSPADPSYPRFAPGEHQQPRWPA
jgi:hypothetical protein